VLRVGGWVPAHRLTRRPAGRPLTSVEPDPIVIDAVLAGDDEPAAAVPPTRRRVISLVAASSAAVVVLVALVRLLSPGPVEWRAHWWPGWSTASATTGPRVPPGASPMAFERTGPAFPQRPTAAAAGPATAPPAGITEVTASPTPPPPAPPQIIGYEAESAQLNGWAVARSVATASAGRVVGWIGARSFSYVRFTVTVPAAGAYPVTVFYLTDERRDFMISVNGGPPVVLSCSSSGGWTVVGQASVTLQLVAGANAIQFGNPSQWAPDLDRITVTVPSP
jgi:hypothetical protein